MTEKMKKKKSSKQKWQKPELTWVALNPEQAVLSCCESSERGANFGSLQCFLDYCLSSRDGTAS
ncbi:MAG: hypothetical protein PHZ27_03310 [Candidatus Omnitrophica bacterium]|jgi:hypothetical protein|nr:hypothetical protein [Candidatus Omnitrophota bacterium]